MQESIEIKGTIIDLKSKLNEQKGRYFHIEWTNEKEFKFLAPLTNGTAMVKGNPGLLDGIKGYAEIVEDRESGITKIEMTTKFRIELKFIIGFGIVSMLYAFFTFKIIPIILVATIFPFAFAWMSKVYRKQEIVLFESVKQYLTKKEAADNKL